MGGEHGEKKGCCWKELTSEYGAGYWGYARAPEDLGKKEG